MLFNCLKLKKNLYKRLINNKNIIYTITYYFRIMFLLTITNYIKSL